MSHVMVDSETLGVRPGSILRSLGAVVFDPKTGALGDEFYVNIDEASCRAVGLTEDASTVKWWAEQSQESRDALLVEPKPLVEALHAFFVWYTARGEFFWCHGAGFDAVLLEAAYRAIGVREPPWKFWNVRCCRTVLALGNRHIDQTREGIHHRALDDAKSQAKAVAAALRGGIKL